MIKFSEDTFSALSCGQMLQCCIVSKRTLLMSALCECISASGQINACIHKGMDDLLATMEAGGQCDIVIIDWSSARSKGVLPLEELKLRYPNQKVGVLFDNVDAALLNRVIVEGASGIFLATSSKDYFIHALLHMASGQASLPIAYWFAMREETLQRRAKLTDREWGILHDLSIGLSNCEISERHSIALPTVKKHIMSLYRKLGVRSRLSAYTKAQQLGLI